MDQPAKVGPSAPSREIERPGRSLPGSALPPSVVLVVENLPVPFDRRVWQEALALQRAGWRVSVICPKGGRHVASFENLEGIAIYRHSLPFEARGGLGFLLEYGAALFHESRLLLRIALRSGIDVIHGCNPPDLIFLAALPYRLFGKRYVFDQHDLCPELFRAKFGQRPVFPRLLTWLERLSMATASLVITANYTFRDLAIKRAGQEPDKIVPVYSVPDKARLRRVAPPAGLRQPGCVVLGYVGIIGDQDGVDHLVSAASDLIHNHARRDFRVVIVGDGPARPSVAARVHELELEPFVTFTGYLHGEDLVAHMCAFDIGVIPDPMNEYNDKISMNKVFEYSALGIPSVSYPLAETMRLLGTAGTYAKGTDVKALAEALLDLIDNPALRTEKGREAQELADQSFQWEHEEARLVEAYARLVPRYTRFLNAPAEAGNDARS